MPSSPPSVGAGPTISFSPHNTLQVRAPFASTSSDGGGPGPREVAGHLQEPSWWAARHRTKLERGLRPPGTRGAALRAPQKVLRCGSSCRAGRGASLMSLNCSNPAFSLAPLVFPDNLILVPYSQLTFSHAALTGWPGRVGGRRGRPAMARGFGTCCWTRASQVPRQGSPVLPAGGAAVHCAPRGLHGGRSAAMKPRARGTHLHLSVRRASENSEFRSVQRPT